jgi:hypothetical protein
VKTENEENDKVGGREITAAMQLMVLQRMGIARGKDKRNKRETAKKRKVEFLPD